MILTLMGLIAAGLIASFVFDDDEKIVEEQEETEAPDEESEEQNGILLTFDGSALLVGAEGDDTLSADQDAALAPDTISLGAGNDIAELSVKDQLDVRGGDGNDTISGLGSDQNLFGEDGDDELSGVSGAELYGGQGDDSLALDLTAPPEQEIDSSKLLGGDGEDTITLSALAGLDGPATGFSFVRGAGEDFVGEKFDETPDTFVIDLELQSSTEDLDDDGMIHATIATISDFNPDVDELVINLTDADGDSEGRSVSDISLTSFEDLGGYAYTLEITFAATETAAEATVRISIFSNLLFDLEDLEFTGF